MPMFAVGKSRIASSVYCAFTSRWRSSAGGADLRQDVGDRRLRPLVVLAQARDELVRAGHVGRDLELEDRDLPRLGQAAGDRLADARQLAALDLAGRRDGRRSCGRGRAHLRPLDVLGDDPALGAGARQRRELDPALAGDPPGERRRLDPAAVLRRLLPRLGDLLGTRRGRARAPLRAQGLASPLPADPRRPAAPRSRRCRSTTARAPARPPRR